MLKSYVESSFGLKIDIHLQCLTLFSLKFFLFVFVRFILFLMLWKCDLIYGKLSEYTHTLLISHYFTKIYKKKSSRAFNRSINWMNDDDKANLKIARYSYQIDIITLLQHFFLSNRARTVHRTAMFVYHVFAYFVLLFFFNAFLVDLVDCFCFRYNSCNHTTAAQLYAILSLLIRFKFLFPVLCYVFQEKDFDISQFT